MPCYAENFLNVMQRVTNTTKHIIFTQAHFVIYNILVKLTILFYLYRFPSAAFDMVNF